MKRAVVLLSGGLDSTVAAYCARKDIGKRGELYALTFEYGQRHSKEIQCAVDIGSGLDLRQHCQLEVPFGCIAAASSLLKGQGEIPTEEERSQAMKQTFGLAYGPSKDKLEEIPSTWVPQRNSIFLALAFAYAETVGADLVYTGFNIKDYSGYPDCRPEFVEQMQRALNLASKQFVETGKGIGIACPLMHKTKAEILEIGRTLFVPFEKTWSCYQGGEKACGVCASCRIRLEAFKKVGLDDPITYKEGVK